MELSPFEYGCFEEVQIKDWKRQRWGGGTDKQPLSDKLPLIQCGETYNTW